MQQYVKPIGRPSILGNNINQQEFDSHEKILTFFPKEDDQVVIQDKFKQQYDDQVVQLKTNKLPKGLVTLESIFNIDDQLTKGKFGLQIKEDHQDQLKIFKGKLLKIGKFCLDEDKQKFIALCQKFQDIFAWKYSNLKGFYPKIAQHTIEL